MYAGCLARQPGNVVISIFRSASAQYLFRIFVSINAAHLDAQRIAIQRSGLTSDGYLSGVFRAIAALKRFRSVCAERFAPKRMNQLPVAQINQERTIGCSRGLVWHSS
jgi:hypothetical protein